MKRFNPGTFTNEYKSSDGQKLWRVLNLDDTIIRMEAASDLRRPALASVEDILLKAMGSKILGRRFKQMAGLMAKQILEQRGFVHEASGIRLNSIPFHKASRYRRAKRDSLHLFRSSSNCRDIGLTDTRDGGKLPNPTRGRWMYVNTIESPLKASIGCGFDIQHAISEVRRKGYFLHTIPLTIPVD